MIIFHDTRGYYYLLADHVAQSVILLVYREYSRICHFGVQFLDDSAIAPKRAKRLQVLVLFNTFCVLTSSRLRTAEMIRRLAAHSLFSGYFRLV